MKNICLVVLFFAVFPALAEEKVCAIDAGKIKLSPPSELIEKLNSVACKQGDKIVVFQQANWGNSILRNKLIGAQICNLDKPHTIMSQGGNTNSHYVICEFSGTVLDVSTDDKFVKKALGK